MRLLCPGADSSLSDQRARRSWSTPRFSVYVWNELWIPVGVEGPTHSGMLCVSHYCQSLHSVAPRQTRSVRPEPVSGTQAMLVPPRAGPSSLTVAEVGRKQPAGGSLDGVSTTYDFVDLVQPGTPRSRLSSTSPLALRALPSQRSTVSPRARSHAENSGRSCVEEGKPKPLRSLLLLAGRPAGRSSSVLRHEENPWRGTEWRPPTSLEDPCSMLHKSDSVYIRAPTRSRPAAARRRPRRGRTRRRSARGCSRARPPGRTPAWRPP